MTSKPVSETTDKMTDRVSETTEGGFFENFLAPPYYFWLGIASPHEAHWNGGEGEGSWGIYMVSEEYDDALEEEVNQIATIVAVLRASSLVSGSQDDIWLLGTAILDAIGIGATEGLQ